MFEHMSIAAYWILIFQAILILTITLYNYIYRSHRFIDWILNCCIYMALCIPVGFLVLHIILWICPMSISIHVISE